MLARRLLIVLAILIGLTAITSTVTPRREEAASPPVAPGAVRPATPPVEKTLDTGESDQRVVARVGQLVVITVESDVLETVSLAEFGNEPVEPASPARFELLADVPGTYAIEALLSGRQIGTLEVRPERAQPSEPSEPGGSGTTPS